MGPEAASRPVSQLLPGMSFLSSLLPSAKSLSAESFLKGYLPARFRVVKEDEEGDLSTEPFRDSLEANGYPQEYNSPETITLEGGDGNCDTACNSSQCSKKKRNKIRFQLARPVPGSLRRHKRSQPRRLLQLRREHHGRGLPSIEVVPATDVVGCKLNSSDIIIMRSEYDKTASFYGIERSADDVLKEPEVLAVMSPRAGAGDCVAEIDMEDGSVWCASRKANGSYEFTHVNDLGVPTVVRWIKRTASQHFSFCTMEPHITKHPFLGSLKPHELDIFETYTPPHSRSVSTRPASYAADGSLPVRSVVPRTPINVSDNQKRLMTVTAIWVSFCEEEWPGTLPRKVKMTASTSRRPSGDHACTPQPCFPTSPRRETFPPTSPVDCRPCSFQIGRSASTGAAYMEKRRTAARAASPSSTESMIAKEEHARKHPLRSKMRDWAHRIFHSESNRSPARKG